MSEEHAKYEERPCKSSKEAPPRLLQSHSKPRPHSGRANHNALFRDNRAKHTTASQHPYAFFSGVNAFCSFPYQDQPPTYDDLISNIYPSRAPNFRIWVLMSRTLVQLKSWGCSVNTATGPQDAIRLALRSLTMLHLILFDQNARPNLGSIEDERRRLWSTKQKPL